MSDIAKPSGADLQLNKHHCQVMIVQVVYKFKQSTWINKIVRNYGTVVSYILKAVYSW